MSINQLTSWGKILLEFNLQPPYWNVSVALKLYYIRDYILKFLCIIDTCNRNIRDAASFTRATGSCSCLKCERVARHTPPQLVAVWHHLLFANRQKTHTKKKKRQRLKSKKKKTSVALLTSSRTKRAILVESALHVCPHLTRFSSQKLWNDGPAEIQQVILLPGECFPILWSFCNS